MICQIIRCQKFFRALITNINFGIFKPRWKSFMVFFEMFQENVEMQPSSKASGYSLGDSSKSGPESRNRDKGKVVKANENTPSKLNVTTPTSRTFNASIIPNTTTTPKVTTTKKSNAGQHKIWTFSIFFHTIVPCVLAKKLFF